VATIYKNKEKLYQFKLMRAPYVVYHQAYFDEHGDKRSTGALLQIGKSEYVYVGDSVDKFSIEDGQKIERVGEVTDIEYAHPDAVATQKYVYFVRGTYRGRYGLVEEMVGIPLEDYELHLIRNGTDDLSFFRNFPIEQIDEGI
jgi:hypothetical protein